MYPLFDPGSIWSQTVAKTQPFGSPNFHPRTREATRMSFVLCSSFSGLEMNQVGYFRMGLFAKVTIEQH